MVEIIRTLDEHSLKHIVKILDNGGVISFPTETVYALAVDAANFDAVAKIYDLKRRYSEKALPVLVGDIYQAKRIAEFDERAKKLAFYFFPGPLTLVLKIKPHCNLANNVLQGKETVGIRMPSNVASIKILQAFGRPLIGTSANISNKESAVDAYEVLEDFEGKIDILVDKGRAEHGQPSTIVDLSSEKVTILREGVIPKKIIADLLGEDIF